MKNKAFFFLSLLPLLMLGAGCASITSDNLHFLDRDLTYTQAKPSGLLYKSPGFSLGDIDAVVLHPVKVHKESIGSSIKSEELAKEFASDFEIALTAAIPKETHLSVLRPGELVPATLKVVDLDVRVTELDPGSGFARWFIGAGAGATKVQVEGQLKTFGDNLVMAFADRRLHSGNPTMGINVASLSDEYTLKELRKEFVEVVVKLLRSQ